MVISHPFSIYGGNMCIRVNRITVNVDTKYDEVKVSLYKTNELLGTLSDEDLELPRYTTSGVSLKAYQTYCKDFVIELMNNGGIPGLYYEPKQSIDRVKYNDATFKSGIAEYIKSMIDERYEYKLLMTERINVVDRYADGYISNATGEFDIRLTQFNNIVITILSDIKSGQLCRPKKMVFNGYEYGFNITNIGQIIKSTQ